MVDSRSNAPGIAFGRPRDASERPYGARPAMTPRHPPSPCPCQRASCQCAALNAQERAPGVSGALIRVVGWPLGAAAAARRPMLADYVVQTTPHGMPLGPESRPARVRSNLFED